MDNQLEQRILACEQENARLRKKINRQNGLWVLGLLLALGGGAIAGNSIRNAVFDSVKDREVVVVDGKGVIRARLGGDLPDAVMAGGRVSKRGSKAAGVMLYDEEGIERGGYVTQDEGSNVMLTLDSKYRQAALFVAGPDQSQASAMKLWTAGSSIELRSDSNGSRLSVADKAGVTHQQPVIAPLSPATCTQQKEYERKYPGERVCQSRYTEAACNACLQSE
ncbi:hypothetical protein [Duganella sp. LjRoot269]|jgi:hypothetical protein|uniref:hypothetical protein n=1 Tax=Duganella sp. LjRoot269 TaxID=3342305 RepID=UPI003ECE8412